VDYGRSSWKVPHSGSCFKNLVVDWKLPDFTLDHQYNDFAERVLEGNGRCCPGQSFKGFLEVNENDTRSTSLNRDRQEVPLQTAYASSPFLILEIDFKE